MWQERTAVLLPNAKACFDILNKSDDSSPPQGSAEPLKDSMSCPIDKVQQSKAYPIPILMTLQSDVSTTMIDLAAIPHSPGCYLYSDAAGTIIYVGKAKDLRKRVTSYFQKKDHDVKTRNLVALIASVDLMVTHTETEALLLENNLIKKHQPKYNIDLKDAKRYAYIEITKETVPPDRYCPADDNGRMQPISGRLSRQRSAMRSCG